jgi:hypothetical protein
MSSFYLQQSFPAKDAKRVAPVVALPEVSTFKPEDQLAAFDAYALYFNALKHKKGVTASAKVKQLTDAVQHAELAYAALGRTRSSSEAVNDAVCKLQLLVFEAADWWVLRSGRAADAQHRQHAG